MGEFLAEAELGEIERAEHDEQRQQRQRDHAVGEAHQEAVEPAAEIARRVMPTDEADHAAHQRRDQADEQRDLAADHQPHQLVAPGIIGAEPVLRGGRIEAREQVGRRRGRCPSSHSSGQAESTNSTSSSSTNEAGHREPVMAEAAPAQPPAADGGIDAGCGVERGVAHCSEIRGSSQP